ANPRSAALSASESLPSIKISGRSLFLIITPANSRSGQPGKNQRTIGSTEAKRITERHINFAFLRGVRHQIDIFTRLIRVIEIDRRWRHLITDSQYGENRF